MTEPLRQFYRKLARGAQAIWRAPGPARFAAGPGRAPPPRRVARHGVRHQHPRPSRGGPRGRAQRSGNWPSPRPAGQARRRADFAIAGPACVPAHRLNPGKQPFLARVRQRARQNHLLLSRAVEMMGRFINSICAIGAPTYTQAGAMAQAAPGLRLSDYASDNPAYYPLCPVLFTTFYRLQRPQCPAAEPSRSPAGPGQRKQPRLIPARSWVEQAATPVADERRSRREGVEVVAIQQIRDECWTTRSRVRTASPPSSNPETALQTAQSDIGEQLQSTSSTDTTRVLADRRAGQRPQRLVQRIPGPEHRPDARRPIGRRSSPRPSSLPRSSTRWIRA